MPTTLDARTLRDAMSRYREALSLHREEIDSLNVFPVPDGDTGTNMLLTQQAVEEALRELDGAALSEVADAISRAALMGARGNSGVILSQVLRGMCARLGAGDPAGAADLAEALARAAGEARRAVANPVDGTMLSVLRDAAAGARGALESGDAPASVAEAALESAKASLERTREQLPALAAAGVVDAGGKGVVLLLDAMAAALRGGSLSVGIGPLGPVGVRVEQEPYRETIGLDYGFEVMYLLETEDAAVGGLKERLAPIGDSLVVVGGGGLYNVHVHTNEPGLAVEHGVETGRPRSIRITSLTDQVEEACLAGEARSVRAAPEAFEQGQAGARAAPQSVVAVAEGRGFEELFGSLGAIVVPGGPGNNPSVGELAGAIEKVPGDVVFLLPNHRNVVPAAREAAERSAKEVEVLPTASMAHGVSVASAFVPADENADNRGSMLARMHDSASAALARAERDAATEAGPVRAGDWLGVAFPVSGDKDRIVAAGGDLADVAASLAARLVPDEDTAPGDREAGLPALELLSLYTGADASPEEAARVEKALEAALPHLEIEVHEGGQPRYPYVIGLE